MAFDDRGSLGVEGFKRGPCWRLMSDVSKCLLGLKQVQSS